MLLKNVSPLVLELLNCKMFGRAEVMSAELLLTHLIFK